MSGGPAYRTCAFAAVESKIRLAYLQACQMWSGRNRVFDYITATTIIHTYVQISYCWTRASLGQCPCRFIVPYD